MKSWILFSHLQKKGRLRQSVDLVGPYPGDSRLHHITNADNWKQQWEVLQKFIISVVCSIQPGASDLTTARDAYHHIEKCLPLPLLIVKEKEAFKTYSLRLYELWLKSMFYQFFKWSPQQSAHLKMSQSSNYENL